MNFRNKKIITAVRILFGLFILMSGVGGLMAGADLQGIPEAMLEPIMQLREMGIFYMIKITEIVSALMLIFNIYPALAALFLAPLAVGIIVFTSFVAPAHLPMGIFVALVVAYFGYAYWDKYKAIFINKTDE